MSTVLTAAGASVNRGGSGGGGVHNVFESPRRPQSLTAAGASVTEEGVGEGGSIMSLSPPDVHSSSLLLVPQ